MEEAQKLLTSSRRVWIARAIAVTADLLQIGLFPLFAEGALSPLSDALDVVVCLLLIWLVGWHIAFLPTFLIKGIPFADLAPTWSIAIWIATRGKGGASDAESDGEQKRLGPSA
jgi:hypothetical protein